MRYNSIHTLLLNMYNLFNKYIKKNLVNFNLKIKIEFLLLSKQIRRVFLLFLKDDHQQTQNNNNK